MEYKRPNLEGFLKKIIEDFDTDKEMYVTALSTILPAINKLDESKKIDYLNFANKLESMNYLKQANKIRSHFK